MVYQISNACNCVNMITMVSLHYKKLCSHIDVHVTIKQAIHDKNTKIRIIKDHWTVFWWCGVTYSENY